MSKKRKNVSRRDFITTGVAAGVGTAAVAGLQTQQVEAATPKWHKTVDVVVVGSGASGLPAAIRALDRKASVVIVEENTDIGGHAMISGANINLGGGTALQKKYGIEDSADAVYLDNTKPDYPFTRYNDRDIIRAFADHNVEVFDFLVSNGVKFSDRKPVGAPGVGSDGTFVPRRHAVPRWSDDLNETINGQGGSGLMRALEKSARAKGAEILLQHRMTSIVREQPTSGRVIGITTTNLATNTTVNIRARQAVIACTGGSSSNVVVRTIFDTRLTEEYQVGCEPYSRQSGDAEQQGMAIGASLGSTSNARNESKLSLQKTAFIGCRYGYAQWNPKSPTFSKAGAAGLNVDDYQDLILVNLVGERFYDETVELRSARSEAPAEKEKELSSMRDVYSYFAAALSSAVVTVDGKKHRVGGPIWAIFDADAVKREKWDPKPPFVDEANGYFFSASTLAELAGKVTGNKYQKFPMPPSALEATVTKYNSFVDMGKDPEFNKPMPRYKIQTPPFYAAWATPILHDTYAGLRVNAKYQVLDVFGKVIPGFYCAGESASGITLHGLSRCHVGGYIAATNAVLERGVKS